MDRVLLGEIRVPGFQRHFVWQPEQAALLMDSIYKGYPFGSLLLWRTSTVLKTEKALGGFELPKPAKDYPIDYVLDGQQRITSIFATFQRQLEARKEDPEVWLPIYYDFQSQDDPQVSRFVALQRDDVVPGQHFPLRSFFAPVEFAKETAALSNDSKLSEIAAVHQTFLSTLIPVQTFESEDRKSVAIVFERVNRLGVELDMFQLLTAWTWSDEFDLQQQFEELSEEFEDFGFGEVGADNDLMLRCCAAILVGDPDPTSLININGSTVRAQFEEVRKALRLAIDFLRRNLHVRHLKYLPYSALLVPLSAYFSLKQSSSVPDAERRVLLRWFWRAAFTHRYSGNPYRNVRSDVEEAIALRRNGHSELGQIKINFDPGFFLDNIFSARTVASRSLILLLASKNPRSFLSGERIDLDEVLSEPNRKEFHHIYPKKYVADLELPAMSPSVNCLANIAFIGRADNRDISAKAPSVYRRDMNDASIDEITEAALLPKQTFDDDWDLFINLRASLLTTHARELMNA
ncbi:DUF262 domain-containing protein [Herbiconiux sp. KACC 21604]|uniref:GmrSD restriction endonuclease domain-containing protein n=1 Tax=unclassified Herbiconiux TaxID=2618217 RepID=UPI001492A873|nr:DUF262 domain-containing protein [Herbiconiux sp. SALV-R1]QJU54525.1 DUF262 domain-containing protein [Herbiconiux sp. SALV-R1]WPO85608.1 DUF262 domain-containing protein [Herbiconiux sp. KACC 21604]